MGGAGLELGPGVSQVNMHVVGVDTDESRTFAASSRERFSLFMLLF